MWQSASCKGEKCRLCGEPAAAKVGEEIMWDDPATNRHNLTAYVCEAHFRQIFGNGGVDMVEKYRRRVDELRKEYGLPTGEERVAEERRRKGSEQDG